MNLSPLVDLTWAFYIMIMGIAALVFAVPLTVLLEAYILRRILRLSFWRSIRDATIMNVATGILGIIVLRYIPMYLIEPVMEMSEPYLRADYFSTKESVLLQMATLMGSLLVLSIIGEGLVLTLLERKSGLRSVWIASLWSNVASNFALFMIFVLYFFDIPKKWY